MSTGRYLALLEDLESRLDAIAADTAEAIRDSIPAYARVWGRIGTGVGTVVRLTNRRLIEAWRDGRQPTSEEFEWLGRIGVPPPELGITLDEILHAYRVSGAIIIEALSRASRADDAIDPQRVLDASLIAFFYLNDLSMAVSRAGLVREQARIQRREDAERALLGALLARPPRIEEANRFGRALGIASLAARWVVVVAAPAPGAEHPAGVLTEVGRVLRRALDAEHAEHVSAPIAGSVVALARPLGARALDDLGIAVVGISAEHEGPAEVAEAYDEATVALDIARRNEATSARFDRLWLDRVLIGSLSTTELAGAILAPFDELPEPKRLEWERTLETFLACDRKVTATARALLVHPHTVRYRMTRIERLLGGALASPDERLALQLALRARRLQKSAARA